MNYQSDQNKKKSEHTIESTELSVFKFQFNSLSISL